MAEAGTKHRVWEEQLTYPRFAAGTAAGLVAGVPMGLLLQFGTDLVPIIGSVTGTRSALLGWITHLVVSAAFGAAFVVFVALPIVNSLSHDFRGMVLLGAVHGSWLGIGMIGVLLPLATAFVASTDTAPWLTQVIPGGGGESGIGTAIVFGVGHLVYGTVLGAAYYYLHG